MTAYSLIVPYFKTPEITRLCLYSIFRFARGTPEVLVVDNAPGSAESAMLREFERVKVIDNPGAPRGSDGNFHALDIGLERATHDYVGLLHSDTIFLQEGWDLECFGRLDAEGLAAIGTFERESNPFRSLPARLRDRWQHLRARQAGEATEGKLMVHFLLTRRSTLARTNFNFRRDRDIDVRHFTAAGGRVALLSGLELGRILWHTSNVTSLLTGQMDDPNLMAKYRARRRQLFADPRIREAFGPVLPPE